ncbi:MAG: oligosaccharide flippase family protein [Fimbriimonadales bacterium]
MSELRRRAVEGSLYLSLRRVFAIALSMLGMLYVTRVVGPANYGLYASAMGVYLFLTQVVSMGVRTYLIRAPQDAPRALWHQAFWWLLSFGSVLTVVALVALHFLGAYWIRTEGFFTVATVFCVGLPLHASAIVAQAALEKELRYKRIAFIDTIAQTSSYAVSIPMALLGFGVWALVAAYWAAQLVSFTMAFVSARYVPRWHWDRAHLRDLLRFSLAQAASEWLYNAKNLAPALVLLPLAGKEAVGYFTLAERLLNMLNFAQIAVRNVTTAVFARVQDQPSKLLHTLYLSSQAQILSLGAASLLFVLSAWYVLPPIFGAQWDIRLAILALALLTAEQLLTATFSAQAQALYIIRQSHVVTRAALLFVFNLYWSTALFTYLAPEGYKVLGYGVAYFLAHLPNNVFLHRGIARYIGKPRYGMNLLWAVALGIALFAPIASYVPLLALSVFALPASQRALRELLQEIRALRPQAQGGI